MWQLKRTMPPFEVVDGPMAGRSFTHGQQYDEIPQGHEYRFEQDGVTGVSTAADLFRSPETVPAAAAKKGKKDQEEVADA